MHKDARSAVNKDRILRNIISTDKEREENNVLGDGDEHHRLRRSLIRTVNQDESLIMDKVRCNTSRLRRSSISTVRRDVIVIMMWKSESRSSRYCFSCACDNTEQNSKKLRGDRPDIAPSHLRILERDIEQIANSDFADCDADRSCIHPNITPL